ncbi:MAG: diadenylate cyclase CdaA [Lachnospiraceae bacterium]|nr:TIGR00159 family protein [Lachnospira sp.]MBR6697191.1 diadenylate cyclase CdaA [Lachnospiraceae bacterium]
MQYLNDLFEDYFSKVYMPSVTVIDIIEIAIIAFVIYHVMVWIKKTKAWVLLKGITVLVAFSLVAVLLNLKTILWIASKTISVGVIALVVIFQPELRKALEQLGRRRLISSILPFDDNKDKGERFSNRTINELIKATYELARTKTGALIVIEQDIELTDYEKTGIEIDALLTSQLLINIFEHNTPLHDGAVLVRGNRVVAATCYLPLSDNMGLSKDLGTRHRAGVGVSEVTDTMTIIVSEETGKVSLAIGGELIRNVEGEYLRNKLTYIQKKTIDVKSFKLWKGRLKNERKASE